MDIYWIKDKTRKGPLSVPDILSLVESGELSRDTKGWHAGVTGWHPLKELPALVDFLSDKVIEPIEESAEPKEKPMVDGLPPLPPKDITFRPAMGNGGGSLMEIRINLPDNISDEISLSQARPATPGMRLLARAVDVTLYMAAMMGVFYALGVEFNEIYVPSAPLFWIPMILLEAVMLSYYRTTPGKKLLGIYLGTPDPDNAYPVRRALTRSILVFVLGLGMMSMPFMPIMMLISLWTLRRIGIVWWDARGLSLPVRIKQTGKARILAAACIIYMCLTATAMFLQPWIQPMYDELKSINPEAARYILQLRPDLEPAGTTPAPDLPQPLQ